jgi:hypothetical protein
MARCTRYNIVIKFVSDLRQVGGFPQVLRLPPPIYDITEILLKVALNTINQPNQTGTMYQLFCVGLTN